MSRSIRRKAAAKTPAIVPIARTDRVSGRESVFILIDRVFQRLDDCTSRGVICCFHGCSFDLYARSRFLFWSFRATNQGNRQNKNRSHRPFHFFPFSASISATSFTCVLISRTSGTTCANVPSSVVSRRSCSESFCAKKFITFCSCSVPFLSKALY